MCNLSDCKTVCAITYRVLTCMCLCARAEYAPTTSVNVPAARRFIKHALGSKQQQQQNKYQN